MKILLVEDDPDLLDLTAYALRREGFLVVEASDAAQALQRLKVDRPDLVVLDLGLPRTDGLTVLQRIQGKDSTPVLVLTGHNAEQDVIKAYSLGADDYVVKPVVA
jgi:DNA-binding response OmpR family regulator